MIKDGKFGVHETIALLTITISAKVFFSSPSIVAAKVGTAGWYMTTISGFVAFSIFLLGNAGTGVVCVLDKRVIVRVDY